MKVGAALIVSLFTILAVMCKYANYKYGDK